MEKNVFDFNFLANQILTICLIIVRHKTTIKQIILLLLWKNIFRKFYLFDLSYFSIKMKNNMKKYDYVEMYFGCL